MESVNGRDHDYIHTVIKVVTLAIAVLPCVQTILEMV